MKKAIVILLSLVIFLQHISFAAAESSAADDGTQSFSESSESQAPYTKGINVEYHSMEDIIAYEDQYGPWFLMAEYDEEVVEREPYSPGKLTRHYLENALAGVNLFRYIAGLNYDVELDDYYIETSQAAAFLCELLGTMTHHPGKPQGVDDELYLKGYHGASHGNLGLGYTNLTHAIQYGWLHDSDANNIADVGHRRWMLNPAMKKTGFGETFMMTSMYAFDESGQTGRTAAMWPAQNTPREYFPNDTAWSISTGNIEDINQVRVKLSNLTTGEKWEFYKGCSDGFFNVNNLLYGQSGGIIWRPDDVYYVCGDTYTVEITGLVDGDIYYTVHIFPIYHGDLILDHSEVVIHAGETIAVTASCDDEDLMGMLLPHVYGKDIFEVERSGDVFYITGKAPGSGTLYIENLNAGSNARCYVTVLADDEEASIELNASELTMETGSTAVLTASVTPSTMNVVWSSSDESVVSVSSSGELSAKSQGTAVITATAGNISASCTVTVTDKAAKIYGKSLSLDGKIGLYLYLDIPEEDVNNTYVRIRFNGNEQRLPAKDAYVRTVSGKELRRFTCLTVAKEMRDEAVLTLEDSSGKPKKLLDQNGNDVSSGYRYSVADYFKSAQETDNLLLKNLMSAMDLYGKYAQLYFGYHTEQVSDLEDVSKITAETLKQYENFQSGKIAGIEYAGSSLEFETDTVIRVYYKLASTNTIDDYLFMVDGKKAIPAQKSKDSDQYYVEIRNIPAKSLGEFHKITVTDNKYNTDVIAETSYCALSYAYTALTSEKASENLKNACRALYLYNQAAIQYFGN